jgi:prepilin-type N-terminal cleavage/methylation domain-containing protein
MLQSFADRADIRTTREVILVSMQRARTENEQDGFTMIELVMAIAISAFAFLALATMLAGTLKALAIGKSRAQGNETATQAIEDLQRYDFNDLGVCSNGDPAPPVPASLAGFTTVDLPNCSGSVVYEQPCTTAAGTLTSFAVPRQSYACVRNNITYNVSRYIRWTDATHTGKRLAVYVSWTDQIGTHQVAQESSLRSPNAASVVGLAPPQFVSVSASPTDVQIAANGSLATSIVLSASTTGLTASDSVYATLLTLTTQPDGSIAALPTQFPLSSPDGSAWSTTIPAGPQPDFGPGNQFVMFSEVRASDSKANSKVATTPLRLCPVGGCPGGLPTIATASVSPTSINIDSAGVLLSTFTVSATTTNLTTDSSVSALVQTQSGAASLILQPSNACSVGGACNSWSGTFAPGSLNLRFVPGAQQLYITAVLPVGGSGGANGASTVSTTNPVTFA